MSKVSTKRLARGVRMLGAHVVGQLSTLLEEPRLARVSTDNLQADKGTFRVNLNVPVMKGQNAHAGTGTDHLPIWIPFTLPPTQEFFAAAPSSNELPDISGDYPRPVLKEVGISFDQRAEAAAITRFVSGSVEEGKLSYDQVSRLDLKVSLYSKDMTYWNNTNPTMLSDRILTFDLPSSAFINTRFRLNPAVQSNLSVPLDPLRTYVIEIQCDGLTSGSSQIPLQLNSVNVSLKFEQGLMGRESNTGGNVDVQNMPTSHNGVLPTSSASIAVPTTASEAIRAGSGGTGTGIQTAFETVDGFFKRLLRGGYNDRSGVPATEQIMHDASYEVIAVPMFGNCGDVYNARGASAPVQNGITVGEMPYNPIGTGYMFDMRRIPIRHPFVLHHAIGVVNWSPNAKDTNVTVPVDSGFTNKVGVGIGTGHMSEIFGMETVAYNEWVPASKPTHRIDQVNLNDGSVQQNLGFELMDIPLVGSSANSTLGTGYSRSALNGKPIFIGMADSTNSARADLADDVNGSVPGSRPLAGKEQWIEVRWKIEDTASKFGAAAAASWKTTDIIIGNGGYWVFLIGKKHLA